MSASCDCFVLSGSGPCIGLITHPEDSYQVWCVVLCVCDREASIMKGAWPTRGAVVPLGGDKYVSCCKIIPSFPSPLFHRDAS